MIGVVDYDMGNLRSVQKAFEHLGHEAQTVNTPEAAMNADRLVVPGVGAFGDAMESLRAKGLDVAIKEFAATGRPLLGICLGLQIFFERSTEYGDHEGLGLIRGQVVRFPDGMAQDGERLRVPHMGWNTVKGYGELGAMLDGKYVYFVHSYYASVADRADLAGETHYGVDFCSAAARDNIWAVQFHPEKSAETGMTLLKAFAVRKC